MTPSSSPFSLTGKTAVVTGASGGIGGAVAGALAQAGASVVLHANRRPQRAIATLKEITAAGGAASMLTADLSKPDKQARFVEGVYSMYPEIDIWVNAAGVDLMAEPVRDLLFDDKLAYLWSVDVAATVRMSRMVGERMRESSGCIVLFGWDGTDRGMEGDTAQLYALAKGAITSFGRSLAQSLAPDVRVCTISPGWIKTAWAETAPDAFQQRAVDESLVGRWGTAEEIANVTVFLASNPYVNAVNIPVNGGFDVRKNKE